MTTAATMPPAPPTFPAQPTPATPATPASTTITLRDLELGQGLAFILGAWRTGTTLLRKVLDSHPRIHSPAETWFLLPLLDLWSGEGTHPVWNRKQAAAALQSHLKQEHFIECCRAFAGRFYAQRFKSGAAYFIDKTPMYMMLDQALPILFPKAKFLVIARDPRGTVWSRHTWKHIKSNAPEDHFKDVAREMAQLQKFLAQHAARSLLVNYESLCDAPEDACRRICTFMGLDYTPAMIDYGASSHHEGYGDEKSREHARPHTASVARYEAKVGQGGAGGGLSSEQQAALLQLVGPATLNALGYTSVTAAATA